MFNQVESSMARTRFPFADRRRLWGVAVSHYPVEGGDVCDWTDWEAPGPPRGGAGSWWGRAESGVSRSGPGR